MFKCVAVFAVLMPGFALAAGQEPKCLAETVNTHQVLVTGEYGGKPFSFTITSEQPQPPGPKAKPAQPSDQPCPMTS